MQAYDWYISPEEYKIAAKNGIKRDTLEHRIRYNGWDKQKAITQPIRKASKWLNIAAQNGIKKNTFNSRVYNLGWSKEKAATTLVKKKYPKWIKSELRKNGIKYKTFLKRIENGWDFKRAYTEKTWSSYESTKKAREIQKKFNIGPYYYINDCWKIRKAE